MEEVCTFFIFEPFIYRRYLLQCTFIAPIGLGLRLALISCVHDESSIKIKKRGYQSAIAPIYIESKCEGLYRFIVFLQISLCFFICQELCWMRGLCISFTSSCFMFFVSSQRGGRSKKFQNQEGHRFRGILLLGGRGVSTPLHAMDSNSLEDFHTSKKSSPNLGGTSLPGKQEPKQRLAIKVTLNPLNELFNGLVPERQTFSCINFKTILLLYRGFDNSWDQFSSYIPLQLNIF